MKDYIKVNSWQEYEELTGLSLGDGAKSVFGKVKDDEYVYEISYTQDKMGKGKVYVLGNNEEDVVKKLPGRVAYAKSFKLRNIKVLSKELAFESKHIGNWYKGIVKLRDIKLN